MNCVVGSVPCLVAQGIEVEAWCWHADPALAHVKKVFLPRMPLPAPLSNWFFSLMCHWRGILHRRENADRHTVVCTTGFYYLAADVAFVHFSNFDWLRKQSLAPFKTVRDLLRATACVFGALEDLMMLWSPFRTKLLAVSEGVREDMRRHGPRRRSIGCFPNAYDGARFSEETRLKFRPAARRALGFSDDAAVFVFASTGHYRRKGFWLAAGAVAELRRRGWNAARLLVVGGRESSLQELQKVLDREQPTWKEWLRFTGMVSRIEEVMSAGDAFLFPSYSESFALAAVEAASLGLPLFLGRYFGSELMLEPGVNGQFVPWDVVGIADVLETELRAGRISPGTAHRGSVPSLVEYADSLAQLLRQTAQAKPVNQLARSRER